MLQNCSQCRYIKLWPYLQRPISGDNHIYFAPYVPTHSGCTSYFGGTFPIIDPVTTIFFQLWLYSRAHSLIYLHIYTYTIIADGPSQQTWSELFRQTRSGLNTNTSSGDYKLGFFYTYNALQSSTWLIVP